MKIFLVFLVFCANCVSANPRTLLETDSGRRLGVSQFVQTIQPGDVILIGESHATQGKASTDQVNQALLIEALISSYKKVSVGMEFLSYTDQDHLDLFLNQNITERSFLLAVSWGQNPFQSYRSQVLAPLKGSGWTYALNSPKILTEYVTKHGKNTLPKDLKDLLPVNFKLGQKAYKKMFMDEMSYMAHHGMDLDLGFKSQSIWDDTMAWNIAKIMSNDPNQILVVIVGQFHIMYDLGLPFRLSERWPGEIKTIFQTTSLSNLNSNDFDKVIHNTERGSVADYIW